MERMYSLSGISRNHPRSLVLVLSSRHTFLPNVAFTSTSVYRRMPFTNVHTVKSLSEFSTAREMTLTTR